MRDVEAFNDALLAKLGWRILTKPQSLMARVLCGRYCPSSSFLETSPTTAASHGWRSILKGRDLLLPNLSKAIGNGQNTNVWNEPWLSPSHPRCPMGPPNREHQHLLVADLLCESTKEWNKGLVLQLLPHEADNIFCIKPSKVTHLISTSGH